MSILKIAVFSLILLSCGLFSECYIREVVFLGADLDALQAILGAWNQSTPHISSNLEGWSSSQKFPCNYGSWRGVLCLEDPVNDTYWNSYVVGLDLSDAGIVGTLPPEIGNFSRLVYLSLTGNPGLSGALPKELGQLTSLNILRLRGSNFHGSIPEELAKLTSLQELDLSGNQFTGQLPSLGGMTWLQRMKVSQNQLSVLNTTGFANLNELTTLDLSGNSFAGLPPNLTSISTLQSVNLSMNQFDGPVDPSSIFNSLSNLTVLDLSNNNFTGPLPNFSLFSQSLEQLDLSLNKYDSGEIPAWLSGSTQLKTLALRASGLFGSFPYTLASLPQLEILKLDNNSFNGTLNIDNISGLSRTQSSGSSANSTGHLQFLSVTYNHITNVDNYSSSDITDVTTVIMLQNNSYCPNSTQQMDTDGQRCYCTQNCLVINDLVNDQSRRNVRKVIIISSVVGGTVLALTIAIATWILWWSKRHHRYLVLHVQQKFAEFEVQPTLFAYNELRAATRDFHPDMKLGQGSYGAVYKGILPNGSEVAVKQLFNKTQQSIDEFLNEVVLITGVKHRNLVKLKGCCLRENKRLLVYEYVENYDLAETLFEGKGNQIMNWPVRFNICLGVARGLFYLHEIAQPRIIHRDIKASNIMLDKNLQAKIADFGLALLFPDEKSHITTMHVAGTMGYLAPEYATRGQLTEKADVFSFGVLLLEVVSGKKNIDPKLPSDEMYLLQRASILHNKGCTMDLVDSTLHLHSDEVVEVQRVINVALLCLQTEGERRPSMAHVVAILQGEVECEVVEKDIEAGRVIRSYEGLLAASESGFGLATISEGSQSSLSLLPGSSRMSLTDSNPSGNIELGAVKAR